MQIKMHKIMENEIEQDRFRPGVAEHILFFYILLYSIVFLFHSIAFLFHLILYNFIAKLNLNSTQLN